MEYLTELPGAFAGVGATIVPVTLPTHYVLNNLHNSSEIETYFVKDDANGMGTLAQGDYLAPVIGGEDIPGIYLGTGTIYTSSVSVSLPLGLLNTQIDILTVSINPISGDFFRDESGKVYFISNQPLSDGRLSVNVRLHTLIPAQEISIPLSQLSSTVGTLLGGTILTQLLGNVGNLTQWVLDSVVLTVGFNANGTKTLTNYQPYCFTAGTLILTASGQRPIESLAVGDLVVTEDGGLEAIRWIGRQRFSAHELRRKGGLLPVRIAKGALGPGMPDRPLIVSQQHRILLSSEMTRKLCQAEAVLVPAVKLVGLPGITLMGEEKGVDYLHLLLDRHAVILANGAWAESLFIGPVVMASLSPEAREEVFLIFPQLFEGEERAMPALPLVTGKESKRLVQRHRNKGLALCSRPKAAPMPRVSIVSPPVLPRAFPGPWH